MSRAPATGSGAATPGGNGKLLLLYHFCRLQLPAISLAPHKYDLQLHRMFELFRGKEQAITWDKYLENLYPLDAFISSACLDRDAQAWEFLFAARAGRADRLLVDALRARAVRLFPRDEEKQENAVADFWGHLLVAETHGSMPILARYDGQRPLVPWLIRIFQNWQISQMRSKDAQAEVLADDELLQDRELPSEPDARWHESFCDAARAWMAELSEPDLLLLGLRMRYRLSQREVAGLLGVHEGTISRQITQLRDGCMESVGQRLLAEGWTGDDLDGFIYSEMASLLTDDPRLSADNLGRILGKKGKALPG
jgi:RNA polymerase sigma factor (sigma-70 family)